MINRRGTTQSLQRSIQTQKIVQKTTSSPSSNKNKRRRLTSTFLVCVAVILTGWPCSSWALPFSSLSLDIDLPDRNVTSNGTPVPTMPSIFYNTTFTITLESGNSNLTIRSTTSTACGNNQIKNAIVILAQKKHATYARDSYGLLIKALELLTENYLSIDNHADNVEVFLFHTGDFDDSDLDFLENTVFQSMLPTTKRHGILKMVNLAGSSYWTLPPWHSKDNPLDWVDSHIFPVGYRHMCRWFGIKIWQFFQELNNNNVGGCQYRHIMRIDEDSFILSPIRYDIFDYMTTNQFVYGFRLCAYELEYNRHIAPWWNRWIKKNPTPNRNLHRDLCGFYNNFFVADLQFFNSLRVTKYLKTLDRQGFVYRKRYGDLMIHTTAVYSYAKPHQIHRFLDFTYQHVTTDHILHPEQGCVVWGGIQAGYEDVNAEETLNEYYQKTVLDKKCTANVSYIIENDLSPTYQHIPKEWVGQVKLKTIMAGKVELPHQGENSG